jgi:7-carboxy-7-deazaguanine synthase
VEADLSRRAGLADLTARLEAQGLHVTIETSGVAFVDELACDLMSISPKLGNAGIRRGNSPPDLEPLQQSVAAYLSQLKFVVESAADVGEVRQLVSQLKPPESVRVMLMRQAVTRGELLSRSREVWDLCQDTGWQFRQRLHILLWGAQRGR